MSIASVAYFIYIQIKLFTEMGNKALANLKQIEDIHVPTWY